MNFRDFFKGEDFKRIFKLSWPVMVGMILQSLLGTVDQWFISKLGTDQMAAASLGNSAAGAVFVLSSLVSSGTVALVARSCGEGDERAVKKISGESILLSAILGLIIGTILYNYTYPIIKIMFNPEGHVLELTFQYLSITFLGTVFVFLSFTLRTIAQALGDTITPLKIFGAANIINAALDPLFIFKLHLGVRGPAMATMISNIFSCAAIAIILIRKLYASSIREFLRNIKLELKTSLRILRIGSWACVQQVSRPITGLIMFRLVNEVGKTTATAAFGVGGQLFNYTFIFLSGLSVGVSIIVGQSLGRKEVEGAERIIKSGIGLAYVNMLLFIIPYVIFPKYIIGIFSTDPGVIKTGVEYLRIVYAGLVFVVYPTIYGGAFQGAGDTFPPMISSFTANVIMKLPLGYILAILFKMGTNGIWLSIALSVVIEAGFIAFYFSKGRWKTKEI